MSSCSVRNIFEILAAALIASGLRADAPPLPLSVPVQQLTVSAPPTANSMPMPRPAIPAEAPTTPSGKLPQYQTGYQQRQLPSPDELHDARCRFMLALPAAAVLVEAVITIDGQPFSMIRERRIDQILQALSDLATADDSPQPTTDLNRWRRYQQAAGRPVSREELRWLLSNTTDGPTVLWLNDTFQRFRALQQPGFTVLDRDHDGRISAGELAQAVPSFQQCDLNRDGVVQFTEIAQAAADPRFQPGPVTPVKLLVPQTAAADREPELRLQVSFDTVQPESSRLTVTQLAAPSAVLSVHGTVVQLQLHGTPVWLEAVQAEASDQISLGAVVDGFPLLPELDPNDDGRLTVRELRGLPPRLMSFDADGDGSLTAAEVQSPVRVCIGLGSTVHRKLSAIRSVHPRDTSQAVAGPEWFVRMDRNRDRDVTRDEFPGGDEQFRILDADGDELISVSEALQAGTP